MKFDQDLRLNLRYDFGKMNSTLGSVVPLAMFLEYVGFDRSSDIYEAAYKKGEGGLSLNKRPKMTSLWSWSLTTEVNRAETSFTQLQGVLQAFTSSDQSQPE